MGARSRSVRGLLAVAMLAGVMVGTAGTATAEDDPPDSAPLLAARGAQPGDAGAEVSQAVPRCFGRPATILARPGQRTVGTRGDDVVVGTAGPDVVVGGGGNDLICVGAGDDRVNGGAGNDRISLGRGTDVARGRSGADRITGGSGLDIINGGSGKDSCLGGTRRTRLAHCERVGGVRMLRASDFGGRWDVAYSNPRLYAVPGPCRDRTPRLHSQGFFMFISVCGDEQYVGNFTPAPLCVDASCRYPFSPLGIHIESIRSGMFAFTLGRGVPLDPTIVCGSRLKIPGGWRIEVTAIDGANRATVFRWRTPVDNCRTVFGNTTGWAATIAATVIRQ